MQAQAGTGGGSGNILQNPKVLIGIIAAAGIAIIAVVAFMFFGGGGSGGGGTAEPAPGVAAPMGGGNGPDINGVNGAPSAAPSADPGLAAPGATPPMAGAPGAPAAPGVPGAPGAPAAGTDKPPKSKGPGVPTGKNPFGMNKELRDSAASIPVITGPKFNDPLSQQHLLWQELEADNPKVSSTGITEGEDLPGPPVPPMRVAAIQRGAQVAAIVQIGSEYFHATPGKMIPEQTPVYRVEQIENDKVVLTRRWEDQGKKGVQRIEVALQGSAQPAAAAPGAFMPGGGFPGGGNGPGGGAGGNGPGPGRPRFGVGGPSR